MPKKTRISGASAPNVYTKQYRKFSGVDFSKSEAMVDDMHSPKARNLVSDTGGFPEKRVGWRVLQTLPGRINGIYRYDGENAEGEKVSCFIIHAGTTIYRYDGGESEPVALLENIADKRSRAAYFKGRLCILTGEEYLVFDGDACRHATDSEDIYAPTTIASREAISLESSAAIISWGYEKWIESGIWEHSSEEAASPGAVPDGGGVNLMTPRRLNSFSVDIAARTKKVFMFILDGLADPNSRMILRCKDTGEVIFDIVLDANGKRNLSHPSNFNPEGMVNGINYDRLLTFDYSTSSGGSGRMISVGRHTSTYVICRISNALASSYIPGIDNFEIEYFKTSEGYADRIDKCTLLNVYENRVFFSGNPDYPNVDFSSAVNDPTYVPDINYTEIGVDSSAIIGYLRTGDSQAIIKEDGVDATSYMRTMTFDSEGRAMFPIKQGTSGMGGIAPHAVCTFLDDPVYLTRNGVYAIAMQDISSERALNIRSTRINKRLLKNANLSDAVMVQWRGYLLLCVGDECYVADAAQKTYLGNKTGTFEYEWYYWTNIPARVFCEHDGELYFGTEDGRFCKFNSDLVNDRGELKSEAYSDDGKAIVAEWATNLSDDGDFMLKKTMVKKGSGVFLKTYNRSGVKVYVRTDAGFEEMIASKSAGVFDFEDIDFADFTFNTSPYSVVPFNTRIKKYSAIQIICRNDKPNHAFGVHSIVRRFFIGNTKK